jgi:iron(III) transport system ATP-binding protein
LEGQYPSQLSGGQQQRVALARAVVAGDDVILFDEPLSNVDAKVREHLRREILKLQDALGFTAVYVTHDQQEAMAMASKVAVLRDGQIEQMGTPSEVYSKPATRYVAEFVGTMNGLDGVVAERSGDRMTVKSWAGHFEVDARETDTAGDQVLIVTRPQHWRIEAAADSTNAGDGINGTVVLKSYAGTHTEYVVDCEEHTDVTVWDFGQHDLVPGDQVVLVPPNRHVAVVTP